MDPFMLKGMALAHRSAGQYNSLSTTKYVGSQPQFPPRYICVVLVLCCSALFWMGVLFLGQTAATGGANCPHHALSIEALHPQSITFLHGCLN